MIDSRGYGFKASGPKAKPGCLLEVAKTLWQPQCSPYFRDKGVDAHGLRQHWLAVEDPGMLRGSVPGHDDDRDTGQDKSVRKRLRRFPVSQIHIENRRITVAIAKQAIGLLDRTGRTYHSKSGRIELLGEAERYQRLVLDKQHARTLDY